MTNQEIVDQLVKLQGELGNVIQEVWECDARILASLANALTGVSNRTNVLVVALQTEARRRRREEAREV